MNESQIRDRMKSPKGRVAENWRVADDAGGRIVGGVFLWHPEPGAERVFVYAIADPRDRAMYEHLLDWGEARGRELTAGLAGRTHTSAGSDNEALAGILRRRGYALVRHFFTMEVDLAEEPDAPAWPDGLRCARSGRARSARSTTWTWRPSRITGISSPCRSRTGATTSSGSESFDPELWFVAEEGDEIAGTALCSSARGPETGWVNVLAVRRPWRRRGLGRALLLHSFQEFRRRGYGRVGSERGRREPDRRRPPVRASRDARRAPRGFLPEGPLMELRAPRREDAAAVWTPASASASRTRPPGTSRRGSTTP